MRDQNPANGHDPAKENVSPADAVTLLEQGALLLDVREDDEWSAGHAPVADHIPMSEISERAGSLPTDRTIVCVCRVGGRSAAVSAALNRGPWQAVNLSGGMQAWERAGLAVVDDAGEPGSVL